MRRTWIGVGGAVAALTIAPAVTAGDHADGPAASADKAADIASLYSWVSPSGATTYLVLNVGRDMKAGDRFSSTVKYVFHTTSMPAYGADPSLRRDLNVICTFDASAQQKTSCWIGNKDFVSGDASQPAGLASASGKTRVFAGLRDDPFFFNLAGFQAVSSELTTALRGGGVTLDRDGCPTNLGASASRLTEMLRQAPTADGGVGSAYDAFADFNVLSIVLAVDTQLLTEAGPVLGVWASTNK